MGIAGRFHDGLTAQVHAVGLEYVAGALVILAADGTELQRWPAADLYAVPSRKHELRLAANGKPTGARVVVSGREDVARVLATLPVLHEKRRQQTGREIRLAVTATVALAAVISAYLYGVPLLAGRIVGLVPPAWEQSLGETVARQMEASLSEGGGLELCDNDPTSLANRAIARFGAATLEAPARPSNSISGWSSPTSPTPSRCRAGRCSSSRRCCNRRGRRTNSPACSPTRWVTSPTGTAWSS